MTDYHQLYNDFISKPKSVLIAPAGYGKTHTISECLRLKEGHQLILTHTHAGVASLNEKIKKAKPDCEYSVETISSFAQKYVEAFYCGEIPDQDNDEFFPFIIKKATQLFKINPITVVLKTTYSGLFVDEYQDCSLSQHQLILALADLFPTHILGDPLQGIFDFNGEQLIDLEMDIVEFEEFMLSDPWRWENKNSQLGDCLKSYRSNLLSGEPIDLNRLNEVENCCCLIINETEIFNKGSNYRNWLNKISYNPRAIGDLNNVVILSHESNVWQRVKLNQHLGNKFKLLEAFDDKDFYKLSRRFGALDESKDLFYDLMILLKGKQIRKRGAKGQSRNIRVGTLLAGLQSYFSDDHRIPNPRRDNVKKIVVQINVLQSNFDFSLVADVLISLIQLENVTITRRELFFDLYNSLRKASYTNIPVIDAMKEIRNVKRRVGRKVTGKCIGTTLLTKGLEFDTVVVLDAHKFTDPRNLYVALTRASKRLIVFSENSILTPYNN